MRGARAGYAGCARQAPAPPRQLIDAQSNVFIVEARDDDLRQDSRGEFGRVEREACARKQHEARVSSGFFNHVVRCVHVARMCDHDQQHLARAEERLEPRERDDVQVEPALHEQCGERSRKVRPLDQCNCWMTRHAQTSAPSALPSTDRYARGNRKHSRKTPFHDRSEFARLRNLAVAQGLRRELWVVQKGRLTGQRSGESFRSRSTEQHRNQHVTQP